MGEFELIPQSIWDDCVGTINLDTFCGPYECPCCAGLILLDREVVDRGLTDLVCPYCRHEVEVPAD